MLGTGRPQRECGGSWSRTVSSALSAEVRVGQMKSARTAGAESAGVASAPVADATCSSATSAGRAMIDVALVDRGFLPVRTCRPQRHPLQRSRPRTCTAQVSAPLTPVGPSGGGAACSTDIRVDIRAWSACSTHRSIHLRPSSGQGRLKLLRTIPGRPSRPRARCLRAMLPRSLPLTVATELPRGMLSLMDLDH